MEAEVKEEDEPSLAEVEPSLAELVIELYQDCLLKGYLISSSFKNILENQLDRIKRRRNLSFILLLVFYSVTRNSFLSYLNIRDEKSKKFWRYFLADTFDEFGLFGQILNVSYAIFAIIIAVDLSHLYVFESKGRLDYLTNMLSLMDSVEEDPGPSTSSSNKRMETLNEEAKTKLLLKMKRKLFILKVSSKVMTGSMFMYDLIGTPLFLYNKRPSIPVGLYAVFNMLIMLYIVYICIHAVLTTYASYVLTSDYFTARMDFLSMELNQINTDFTENQVNKVLFLYNELIKDFQKQDYLLKYLLRNLIHAYCIGLAVLFLMFTVEMNPFIRPVLLTAVTVISLGMMLAGLYVGKLQSRVMGLYREMNQVFARNVLRLRLKSKRNLLNCIKELGSQKTDGQFVLGLRDGHGAATSSKEIFDLTLNTISTTLMLMSSVYYSQAI